MDYSYLVEGYYNDAEYIVNNVPILYKYSTIENCIKILNNCEISFKHPSIFNDPFDCYFELIDFSNPNFEFLKNVVIEAFPEYNRSQIRNKISEIKIKSKGNFFKYLNINPHVFLLNDTRISCFSEINNNLLMWSHYSNSHTGVCIGFDRFDFFNKILHEYDESAILRIDYIDNIQKYKYFENEAKGYLKWLSSKSSLWKYEKEIRIYIRSLKFNNAPLNYMQNFDLNCIKSVYLGCKINKSYISEIINLRNNNNLSFKIFIMKENKLKFDLIPEQIY